MVSITVTGATVTKGYKGLPAIEEIQKGIRFRIAVRDEIGGWLYHTCHIEDSYLLEKVKMMGLCAGSDIDFVASMRAVRIKEDGRTKNLSVFLIRHIEFGRPREEKGHSQTEMKKPKSVSDPKIQTQFENSSEMNFMSMIPSSNNSNMSLRNQQESSISISSLPGFLGYEVIEEDGKWMDLKK